MSWKLLLSLIWFDCVLIGHEGIYRKWLSDKKDDSLLVNKDVIVWVDVSQLEKNECIFVNQTFVVEYYG